MGLTDYEDFDTSDQKLFHCTHFKSILYSQFSHDILGGGQLVEWAGNACWSELTCLERVGGASWQIWSELTGASLFWSKFTQKPI